MRATRIPTLLIVVGVSVMIGTAGCATGAPTPADPTVPASTPSPGSSSPEAVGTVGTLVFSGSDVRALSSSGAAVDTVGFAGGAEPVVALISAAVGAPTVTEHGEECAAAHTLYSWENLVLNDFHGGADFAVGIDGAASGTVALETTGGFSVGDDMSTAIAQSAADDLGRPGGVVTYIALDAVSRVTEGEYTSPVGAVGYLADSVTLTSVITPGEWSSFLC